jgi:hypothetical protein
MNRIGYERKQKTWIYTKNGQSINATKGEQANISCYKIIWSVLTKSVLVRGDMTQTIVKSLDQVNWCLRQVTVFLGCRHIYLLNRYFRADNVTVCLLPFPFRLSIMNYAVQVTTHSYTHVNAVCFTIYTAEQSLNCVVSAILRSV